MEDKYLTDEQQQDLISKFANLFEMIGEEEEHEILEYGDKVKLGNEIVDFDACVMLMDDEIGEELHRLMGICSSQNFLDEYVRRHHDKFKEDFKI